MERKMHSLHHQRMFENKQAKARLGRFRSYDVAGAAMTGISLF
jgi:hypothetical protein